MENFENFEIKANLMKDMQKKMFGLKQDFNNNLDIKKYHKVLNELLIIDQKLENNGIKTGCVIDSFDNEIFDPSELDFSVIHDSNIVIDYYIRLSYIYNKNDNDIKKALSNNENVKNYYNELLGDVDLMNDCIMNNGYCFNIYDYIDDFDTLMNDKTDKLQESMLNTLPARYYPSITFKYYLTTKNGTFVNNFSKDVKDNSLTNIYNLYLMNNLELHRIDLKNSIK